MILSDGICSIFRQIDVSEPGGMPMVGYELKDMGYFGLLDFATVEAWPTEGREEIQADARIRVLQDRTITNSDVVVLQEAYSIEDGMDKMEVVRAWHGRDQESGMLISDLTLRRISAKAREGDADGSKGDRLVAGAG